MVCRDGVFLYTLFRSGEAVLNESPISLFSSACITPVDATETLIDRTWQPTWGQWSRVRDHCQELTIGLKASGLDANLLIRAYNDGVAFRFNIPAQSGAKETTAVFACGYNIASPGSAYVPNGEDEPLGPVRLVAGANLGEYQNMPALLEMENGLHLTLLESDLFSAKGFEAATLTMEGDQLQSQSECRLTGAGLQTPWRVILVSEEPGATVVSTTPINLASPCQLADTSWVKPGKAVWDWRVHGYQSGDFTYGINNESYERFIDFAASNRIEYLLIDDHWYTTVEAGELVSDPHVNIEKLVLYARERGVEILLYYDEKKGVLGDEHMLTLYSKLGTKGVKYGFKGNDAAFTRRAIERAGKNRLAINFHDNPCPMPGVHVTMPNLLAHEFCHCQQDRRTAFTPTAFLKMAVVNALAGPVDQCNGVYDLNAINEHGREKSPRNPLNSTVVSETARTLVIFTGLLVLPDAPEAYEQKDDLFDFIRRMPATWDDSRVLGCEIGKHITTARRKGEEWFVGSVINEDGGSLTIPLAFLEPQKSYIATFYEDAPDSHYVHNRESYRVRTDTVSSETVICAQLAPGGGQCMWIKPE